MKFSTHTNDDILIVFELATEAVVFPELRIVRARGSVHHQNRSSILRHHIAERSEDWCVGHVRTSGAWRHLTRRYWRSPKQRSDNKDSPCGIGFASFEWLSQQ